MFRKCLKKLLGSTKKTKILAAMGLALFLVLVVFVYFNFIRVEPQFKEDLTAEVNSKAYVKDYVESVKNGSLANGDEKIDTSKTGDIEVKVEAKKGDKVLDRTFEFTLSVVDTTKPELSSSEQIIVAEGSTKDDILKKIAATDNSGEDVKVKIKGEYDLDKTGKYSIKCTATDSSGNKVKGSYSLLVKERVKSNGNPYYIEVNRKQNVVYVYGLEDGVYTKLVKTFICSTGTSTPTGTYSIGSKDRWRALYEGVFGQYSSRITGDILFHSVPYQKQDNSTLEYWEFNKLGTEASLGCVRLMVKDVKWIYDNCASGTKVKIYDSDTLDAKKPTAPTIDKDSPNKGWDPTDPDPDNPW